MLDPISLALGFTAGAFTPAIGRKIKALFVKEGNAAKAAAAPAIATAAKAAEADAAKAVDAIKSAIDGNPTGPPR